MNIAIPTLQIGSGVSPSSSPIFSDVSGLFLHYSTSFGTSDATKWSPRSGTGDATQGTALARPVLTAGAIGGRPGYRINQTGAIKFRKLEPAEASGLGLSLQTTAPITAQTDVLQVPSLKAVAPQVAEEQIVRDLSVEALKKLTVPQLKQMAAEEEIDLGNATREMDIIHLIRKGLGAK